MGQGNDSMTADFNASPRIATLDFIRGAAVLAILAVNIFSFALPDAATFTPFWRGDAGREEAAYIVNYMVADGKFRGLFTLLFGASMAMIMDRARANGLSAAQLHLNRMIWLGVMGALHMLLLWHGDILLTYAVAGAALTWVSPHASARRLLALGVILLIGGAIMLGGMSLFSSPHMAAHIPYLRDHAAMMMEMITQHDTEMRALEHSINFDFSLYLGPYADLLAYRMTLLLGYPASFVMSALETIPLMLIGMGLYRSGFLTGQHSHRAYAHIIALCLPAGMILTGISLWPVIASGYDPLVSLAALISFSVPGRLLLILAYAALLVVILRHWPTHTMTQRICAAGRMALSNYLATSLMMTSIFYGYGLGLYGQLERWSLYGFVALGCAAMLACSQPWLAHFHYGPLEWVWRSLARGEAQPFRRR